MNALEIGRELVRLYNAGRAEDAVERLYSRSITSIEAQGSKEMPARIKGIQAVRAKRAWWSARTKVHSTRATGPYRGLRKDQFAVLFAIDLTDKASRQRSRINEIALYTVRGGKIVQEEFLQSS